MRGLVCRGPDTTGNDEPTYVLLDDWVGAGLEAEAAGVGRFLGAGAILTVDA